MDNFRQTDITGIKHIRAHYKHFEAVGVSAGILEYEVPIKNYQTGETQIVKKYCVWRIGTEAIGSGDLGDGYEGDKEDLHNFSRKGIVYSNPKIVRDCGGFGELVGLQNYVD